MVCLLKGLVPLTWGAAAIFAAIAGALETEGMAPELPVTPEPSDTTNPKPSALGEGPLYHLQTFPRMQFSCPMVAAGQANTPLQMTSRTSRKNDTAWTLLGRL